MGREGGMLLSSGREGGREGGMRRSVFFGETVK